MDLSSGLFPFQLRGIEAQSVGLLARSLLQKVSPPELVLIWNYTANTGNWQFKYQKLGNWEVKLVEEEEERIWLEEREEFEESGGTEGISQKEFEEKQKEQAELNEGKAVTLKITPEEIRPGEYRWRWPGPNPTEEPLEENNIYKIKFNTTTTGNTFGTYTVITDSMWGTS